MIDNTQIGITLKKMRKSTKLNQERLSVLLSCDQTAVSRIENGKQALSIEQLVSLSQFYGVELDLIVNGLVNYWDLSERFGQKPKLKARYQNLKEAYAREAIPLITMLSEQKGFSFTRSILEELHLEGLPFLAPEEKISSLCLLDIISESAKRKALTKGNILEWVMKQARLDSLGSLFQSFVSAKSSLDICNLLVLNSSLMDGVFDQRIIESDTNHTVVSFQKKDVFASHIDFSQNDLNKYLISQKEVLFENFPRGIDSSHKKIKTNWVSTFESKNLEGKAELLIQAS